MLKNKLSIKRITFLGFLLAVSILLKYVFGYVPGVEMISFIFIVCSLFLPLIDLTIFCASFNLIILAIYGFNLWWISYWLIWPLIIFCTKVLSKISKNKFVFGLWGLLSSIIVMMVYFISDLIIFDKSFAILNLISALPIQLIEGLVTMLLIILIAPKLLLVVKNYSFMFWNNDNTFFFKPNKYLTLNYLATTFLTLINITSIICILIFNSLFLNLKEDVFRKNSNNFNQNIAYTLDQRQFNDFKNNIKNNEVIFVVLANQKYSYEVAKIYENETSTEMINNLNTLFFNIHKSALGNFIGSYHTDQNLNWLHGTSSSQNYGDYYPLFLLNHSYAPLSIFDMHLQSRDIVELTYDF